MKNIIKVENLSKTFYLHTDKKNTARQLFTSFFSQGKVKKFNVLSNVSFEVKQGEFIGIVGRNGSGKSTLLKIIADIYEADKGSKVEVNGKVVPFLELGVGFNEELTGRENIFLNGTILGMTKSYLNTKFDEIVDFAELRDFIDEPVKTYSSGMLVRLAFSIAIQSDADLYILDEILSVGDSGFQRKSAHVFADLKKQGKSVLYVSHDINTVKEICDKAILIDNGEMVAFDKPERIGRMYEDIILKRINKSENDVVKEGNVEKAGNSIKSITFMNTEYKPQKVYERGQPIHLKIDINVEEEDNEMYVGVGILDFEKDVWITAVNTAVDEFEHSWKKGSNELFLSFNNNTFNKGRFYVVVSLFKKEPGPDSNYDYFDSRETEQYLEVFSSDRRNGKLFLEHEWKQGEQQKNITMNSLADE
ncbi:ABC transporter ATP-binding protein [Candidatus Dojkabacteria bacterium]|uniref:ABC transporter ATP-binding protein n=1 Tax=Candidatus Dojkabacteria bacterium TaxID=2099670 RepID=A0A955LAZ5_9BACT|nr:ABC transporter ATP-binding protein [Candidatus Dojkabacteria bacterium]